MPTINLYDIFATPKGLVVRPNPALNVGYTEVCISSSQLMKLFYEPSAVFAQFSDSHSDPPFNLDGQIPIDVNGSPVLHDTEARYYDLSGALTTYTDTNSFYLAVRNDLGFTNPSL